MGEMQNEWPDDFPESCPPQQAEKATGQVFRLVAQTQPAEDDFRSVYRLNPSRFSRADDEAVCRAMGLSTFDEQEDAETTRRTLGPFKNHKIAVGTIDDSGLMLATPSQNSPSHRTWWPANGDTQWKTFRVV
jgi:hypothetical protein